MTDRLVDAQGRTVREVSGYPYERRTPEHVAKIQHLLIAEMVRLDEELRFTKRRLHQIMEILEEMDIDIDVMLATKEAFKEKPPKGCIGCLVDTEPHTCGFTERRSVKVKPSR